MRFMGFFLAAALSFPGAASAQTPTPLNRMLESELSRFMGPAGSYKAGIFVKHLATGEEASVRGTEHFDSASTIKMAVMVLAYQLADQKRLNLDERYELKLAHYRGGSGIFRYKDPGLKPTIRDVITQMIVTSDNSATDIMIAKVGGVDKVNAFLKQAGFATLHLNMTTNDYFRRPYDLIDAKYKLLSPEDVFALNGNLAAISEPRKDLVKRLRDEAAANNVNEKMRERALMEGTWLGIVTPAEMGRLLEGIERDTIASKESCEEMKRIMRGQLSGTRKIPHFLSVPVAHKTGETAGVTNDVGMIYAKSGPIIMAIYTIGYSGLAGEADERLGQVARMVVEYFDGRN